MLKNQLELVYPFTLNNNLYAFELIACLCVASYRMLGFGLAQHTSLFDDITQCPSGTRNKK